MLRRRGARLAAERSEEERSGAKRRGRGLGRRNTGFEKKLQYKPQKNLKICGSLRQSPCARKALCTIGRAGPLACAAAADRLRP